MHTTSFRSRRARRVVLAGAAAAALTAGNVSVAAQSSEPTEPAELQTVEVAISTGSPYYYGLWVADQLGFFEEEGLDPEINITGGSSDVAAIVAANNVDIGSASTEPLLPVFEQGGTMYPFYVYTVRVPYDILVPVDSEVQTLADIDGGTIGVSELAGGETTAVRAALETEGLVPDEDVSIIEVGTNPGAVLLAFERGDIAALGVAASDIPSLAASGIETRSVMPDVFGINDSPAGLTVATERFKDETEAMAGYGRALAKGQLIGYELPDVAVCLMAEALPAEFEDLEAGRASYESALIPTTQPQNEDGTYEFSRVLTDLEQWEAYQQIFVSGGVIEEPVDIEPYIIDVLDEINDFDQAAVLEAAASLPTDC